MNIRSRGKKVLAKVGLELTRINFVMDYFLKWGENQILKTLVVKNERNRPLGAQEEKYFVVRNLMKSFEKKLKSGSLAPAVRDFVFNRLVGDAIINWRERHPEAWKRRQEEDSLPLYVVISPTQKCNLACVGCYAASSKKSMKTLEWDIVDRIIDEKRKLWGSYFTVISGGEPLLYEDKGAAMLTPSRACSSVLTRT